MSPRPRLLIALLFASLLVLSGGALAQQEGPAQTAPQEAPASDQAEPEAEQRPAQEQPQAQPQQQDPQAEPQQQDQTQQPAQPQPQQQDAPAPAPTQFQRPHDADQFPRRVAEIIEKLDKVEKSLGRNNLSADQFDRLRKEIDESLSQAAKLVQEIQPKLEAVNKQLEKLGDPPAEGQPEEPAAIAAERASLQAQANRLESTLKVAQASQVRANQLAERVQNRRRDLFTSQLFERTTKPLSLMLWQRAFDEMETGWRRFDLLVENSLRRIEGYQALYAIGFLTVLIFGLLQAACWFGVKHFRDWTEETPPPFWQRAASGAWVIVLRALPMIVTATALYGMLSAADLLTQRMAEIVWALMIAIITVAAVSALSTTILAPKRPPWRILPVSSAGAKRINRLILAIAAVYGIDQVLSTINEVLYMPLATTIAQSSATNVLFALLLTAVVMTRAGGDEEPGDPQFDWLRWLRLPGYALALTILGATAAGYVAFGRFLAAQVVVTGSILIVVYLMLVWVNAVGDRIRSGQAGPRTLPPLPSDARRREQVALVLTLVLKAVVFAMAFPIILMQWGFDRQDLRGWAEKAFFGFQAGGLTISIATLIGALMVFLVAYAIARVLLNWLDGQVMEPAGLSGGARDSIRTGLGYTAFIAAALLGMSYAGVELSNLAIVAGALSVGIGFGLQSIVNNFVSGLILLAERPIKVGDWVVVGQDQGFVRKISVRSTEIETFDRANVVVPNSVLISEKVQNWTLHNNVGRVTINVKVSYNSDPERVRDILQEVAHEHPQVLTHPEPYVWFNDFGDSSLDFTLFLYALNITRQLGIQTDIRIAILKKFREEGIEIPYPQSDVHFRDLGWLKTALTEQMARIREERASEAPTDGTPFPHPPGGDPNAGAKN